MAKQPEIITEWQAPEFRHYPKNAAWFITLGIIIILLLTYLVFQKDWFGAISVGIMGILTGIFATHRPKTVTVRISDKGIHTDYTYIPYSHIKHFWIVDNERHQTLNIETTAYLNHILSIELAEQDPDFIRDIMNELLPEHSEADETLAQRIAHKFKF